MVTQYSCCTTATFAWLRVSRSLAPALPTHPSHLLPLLLPQLRRLHPGDHGQAGAFRLALAGAHQVLARPALPGQVRERCGRVFLCSCGFDLGCTLILSMQWGRSRPWFQFSLCRWCELRFPLCPHTSHPPRALQVQLPGAPGRCARPAGGVAGAAAGRADTGARARPPQAPLLMPGHQPAN